MKLVPLHSLTFSNCASVIPIYRVNVVYAFGSGGGGGTWYIWPTRMCRFTGYRFHQFFLEQGIKVRTFF